MGRSITAYGHSDSLLSGENSLKTAVCVDEAPCADFLADPDLSLAAKGALAILLSPASPRVPTVSRLCEMCTTKRKSMAQALNSLEEAGYIKRVMLNQVPQFSFLWCRNSLYIVSGRRGGAAACDVSEAAETAYRANLDRFDAAASALPAGETRAEAEPRRD